MGTNWNQNPYPNKNVSLKIYAIASSSSEFGIDTWIFEAKFNM